MGLQNVTCVILISAFYQNLNKDRHVVLNELEIYEYGKIDAANCAATGQMYCVNVKICCGFYFPSYPRYSTKT